MGVLVALLAVWVGPAGAAEGGRPDVVAGNNAFAFDLYRKLVTEKGRAGENLFFSPYGISTALAMAYAGARGDTEAQMARVLHFGPNRKPFHGAMGRLVRGPNVLNKKEGCQVSVANALWAQKDYEFLRSFSDLVANSYQAGLNTVDFAGETEAARKTINRWVERRTQKKIKELFARGVLSTATRLVLTNAVYFKGDWDSPFDEEFTEQAPFALLDGETVEVPMMSHMDQFRYTEGVGFQALELPYEGRDLSMVILLPREADGLAAFEQKLAPKALSTWLDKMRTRDVEVFLPRFTMTSGFMLKKTLSAMGMPDAFTEGAADLSGMDGTRGLFLSAVVHKAFVDVNETGTEAAAATGVSVDSECAPPEAEPPVVFRADHPFVLLIRGRRSGSILFLGRVTDPES